MEGKIETSNDLTVDDKVNTVLNEDESLTSEREEIIADDSSLRNTDKVNEYSSNPSKEVNEEEWQDILGSGQLLKKILKKGTADSRPQRLDVCTVKYIGKYENNIVDERLVTINIGDAEVVQGLDLAISLMDVGEEAEIVVGPRFAFGSVGQSPDIPPDATLHYTVTLISAEPEPVLETLTLEKRKEVGNRKKERGNYWYSRKDYTLAIQCYRRALEYLDDNGLSALESSKSVSEDQVHSLLEDRIKVYNNLAAAQMKIKAFDSALQSVDNVLMCQSGNVKALFRKGKILAEKGETEDAISYLKEALAFEPENVQAKNELNQLLVRRRKDIDLQKRLYKKMLGTNKPVENKVSSPTADFRRWGVVAGCVGAAFSMLVAYKWFKPV